MIMYPGESSRTGNPSCSIWDTSTIVHYVFSRQLCFFTQKVFFGGYVFHDLHLHLEEKLQPPEK